MTPGFDIVDTIGVEPDPHDIAAVVDGYRKKLDQELPRSKSARAVIGRSTGAGPQSGARRRRSATLIARLDAHPAVRAAAGRGDHKWRRHPR